MSVVGIAVGMWALGFLAGWCAKAATGAKSVR
jgi:hypothetical protein